MQHMQCKAEAGRVQVMRKDEEGTGRIYQSYKPIDERRFLTLGSRRRLKAWRSQGMGLGIFMRRATDGRMLHSPPRTSLTQGAGRGADDRDCP